MAHYRSLKAKNPSTTFKEALKSAAPLYRQLKGGQRKVLQTANHTEFHQHQHGGIVKNMEFDFNYELGLFDDGLQWSQ